MPPGLSGPEKRVWRRLVPVLVARQVLTDADSEALCVLVKLRADFEENAAAFNSAKLAQLRMLLAEFGLTPASRARVPSLEEAPKPEPPKPDGKVVTISDLLASTRGRKP
jgi:phage terminase small subunit